MNYPIQVVTIGAYGFSEENFFAALQQARVDTFCDIRRRRGVRGSEYAFANSQRLQRRLAALGIRYLHDIALAPPQAIRLQQMAVDAQEKVAKRKRSTLSPAFITAYEQACLSDFDAQTWLSALPNDAQIVALFCVERDPAACHRSLVANRLKQTLQVEVIHL